jgi:hypothetical protein
VNVSRPVSLQIAAISALVLALVALVGCAPTPEPTPTPTAVFASEEEAFAAAEETYREFTRRLNAVDTSDPETFEPLFSLSSGDFERADREAYSAMYADGITVEGDTKILSFDGTKADPPFTVVEASVCLDVREVTVLNAEGVSQVDPGRPDVYGLRIIFLANGATLSIDSASVSEDAECDAL